MSTHEHTHTHTHTHTHHRHHHHDGSRNARSPPARRRKLTEADLPGGVLLRVQSVHALAIDPGASARLEEMLRRDAALSAATATGSNTAASAPSPPSPSPPVAVDVVNVPASTLKRGAVVFHWNGRRLIGLGQSTSSKNARALAWMHAVQLLDYYTIHESAPGSYTAPAPPTDPSQPPPPPPPLPLQETKDAAALPPSTAHDDCEGDAAMRLSYYLQMRIPPSGHPLVDTAAAGQPTKGRGVRGGGARALQLLQNEIRDASQRMRVGRVAKGIVVATLPMVPAMGLVATGVSDNAKTARQRCAAHALEILRLHRLAASRAGAPPAPLDRLVESLGPQAAALWRMWHFLDPQAPTPSLQFRRGDGSAAETHDMVCELTLGPVTVEGRGSSRFEAERDALATALDALELHDDDGRLAAVRTFVARYPELTPAHLAPVALPAPLIASVQETMQWLHVQYPSDACGTTSPAAGTGGGSAVMLRPSSEEEELLTMVQARTAAAAAAALAPGWSNATTAATPATPPSQEAQAMQTRLAALRAHPRYLSQFHDRRRTLAMAALENDILDQMAQHRVVVVCGTTGCGKTTQVPQYILDAEIRAGRGDVCNIIVTQPRRLSAFSVAERIAAERLTGVGGGSDVGYAVRLDAKPGRHLTLCTTGVLLQVLSNDPTLAHVSHLILDEVHERDINCDVVLALTKQLLQRHPHLRVVLMSATMQSQVFAAYFQLPGQPPVPVLEVDGATYPVEERYLEDVAAMPVPFASPMLSAVRAESSSSPSSSSSWSGGGRRGNALVPLKTDYRLIAYLIHQCVQRDLHGHTGGKSVLVFLPGWKELLAAKTALEAYEDRNPPPGAPRRYAYHVILLHSTVDAAKQRQCFQPAPPGMVKVVLATNIAESGITIDDAAVVIDTGLIKTTSWVDRGARTQRTHSSFYRPWDEVGTADRTTTTTTTEEDGPNRSSFYSTQLTLGYASKANGTQRRGRAGRTQGGVCYRLFTRQTWARLPAFAVAEIHRTPLTQVLLKLLVLGYDKPKETLQTFMEPPAAANVHSSMQLLQNLSAVDDQEALTTLGRYLAKLPCDPRIGKMIMMGALLQCLDSVLTVAAAAELSPFVTSREVSAGVRERRYLWARHSQSDHIAALNAYNAYCANDGDADFARHNYLHEGNLRLIARYKAQYRDILHRSGLITQEELSTPYSYSPASGDGGVPPTESESLTQTRETMTMMDSGFAPSLCVDRSVLSRHAAEVALVKACVCAALFPHVARLADAVVEASTAGGGARPRKKLQLRTRHRPRIAPSKESACRRVGGPATHGVPSTQEMAQHLQRRTSSSSPSSPSANKSESAALPGGETAAPAALFYVYQDVFYVQEARQEFLTTVSSVSLWALLLFGASATTVHYDRQVGVAVVDEWIFLKMDARTFDAVTSVRDALHACAWRKYQRPRDSVNNEALARIRRLVKAMLEAPLEADGAHTLHDTGVIVDPRPTRLRLRQGPPPPSPQQQQQAGATHTAHVDPSSRFTEMDVDGDGGDDDDSWWGDGLEEDQLF